MKIPHIYKFLLIVTSMAISAMSVASDSKLPEPFQGDTPNSPYKISYDDYDALLKATVLSTGKSNRAVAKKSQAKIGTKLKVNTNKLTALEGNRFFFEAFKEDDNKELLSKLRKSLEKVPSEAPLKEFTKKEQLAYWLNLYNVTVLDEIVKIYPESRLEDFIDDKFDEKLLTVSGVKLSLNDIQYKILKEKYDHDPLIMYGLYQGIIGGPNIRKTAFTGDNVYQALAANADEFVNSNRGTYAAEKGLFRVSSFYKRNEDYFPHFKVDLKEHLLAHLSGSMRYKLENAEKIKANISNWKITDLYGTTRSFGGGNADNSAALLDSVSTADLPSAFQGAGAVHLDAIADSIGQYTVNYGRFSPEQIAMLKGLDKKRLENSGSVTVTDIEKDKESDN